MTDRPIIFSCPMVRALLDGRKTQTRRAVKIKDHLEGRIFTGDLVDYYCNGRLGMVVEGSTLVQPIPYAVCDRLYVREAHYLTDDGESEYAVFAADQDAVDEHLANMQTTMASHPSIDWSKHLRLRPSIHMPRWASRLTLVVTDVRVQRLQEISEADARAEGAAHWWRDSDPYTRNPTTTANGMFRTLWNSLHGADAWDANPWVIALTFTVHKCNIDQMGEAA